MNAKAQTHKAISGGLTSKGRPLTLGDRIEARRRPLPPIRPLRTAEVAPRLALLTELGPNDCHYPYGESGDFRFCGHPKMTGKPYCRAHCCLCYRPVE
jgi:hypothetical protein